MDLKRPVALGVFIKDGKVYLQADTHVYVVKDPDKWERIAAGDMAGMEVTNPTAMQKLARKIVETFDILNGVKENRA